MSCGAKASLKELRSCCFGLTNDANMKKYRIMVTYILSILFLRHPCLNGLSKKHPQSPGGWQPCSALAAKEGLRSRHHGTAAAAPQQDSPLRCTAANPFLPPGPILSHNNGGKSNTGTKAPRSFTARVSVSSCIGKLCHCSMRHASEEMLMCGGLCPSAAKG